MSFCVTIQSPCQNIYQINQKKRKSILGFIYYSIQLISTYCHLSIYPAGCIVVEIQLGTEIFSVENKVQEKPSVEK